MVFSYSYVNTNPSRSLSLSCQSFSTGLLLFKWIRSFSTSARSTHFFSTLFVSFVPSCLCFSRPPTPFSSRTQISFPTIHFIDGGLSILFLHVPTRWFSWRCSTRSSFFILFFFSGFNSNFGIEHSIFFWPMFFMPVHLLTFPACYSIVPES